MILNYIYPSYNKIEVPCLIESDAPVANTQYKLLGILMAFFKESKNQGSMFPFDKRISEQSNT